MLVAGHPEFGKAYGSKVRRGRGGFSRLAGVHAARSTRDLWSHGNGAGAGAHAVLRGAHGNYLRRPCAALPVDGRVRGVQFLGAAASGSGNTAGCAGALHSEILPARGPSVAARPAERAGRGGGRGTPDPRRAAHREAAAGTRARRRPHPRLEWEQDGQYFHYLTKWMHALDKLTRATGDPRYTAWARELMETTHRAFLYSVPGRGRGRRMYWKMSVDFSRPLVSSQGAHDPLDGFVTCIQLEDTAEALGLDPGGDAHGMEVAARRDFHSMLCHDAMATTDMLGIGGLLADISRLHQLRRELPLRDAISRSAVASVKLVAERGRDLDSSASRRLAFRELGLAIGMAAGQVMQDPPPEFRHLIQGRYASLGHKIQSFWLCPDNRSDDTYLEHEDINDVMLATSLAPDGFLRLVPLREL